MRRIAIFILVLGLSGCKKDPPVDTDTGSYSNGIFVLNEGLFQQNNASITFYSLATSKAEQQVFLENNNRGLGDTANDMDVWNYGDSTYLVVAVDVSSQIEIINASNMKSVAQIPLFDGAIARQPRHVVVSGNRAFSCNYDGTVSVIDLISKEITNTINVGANPDGMDLVGDKLYVSNSGGLNYPEYDSTISVVDINAETELMKIPSRINCGEILADAQGDIYVISNGNYSDLTPALLRIDTQLNQLVETIDIAIGSWTILDDWIYYYDSDLNGVYRFNTVNETFENVLIIDCSDYDTMYGVHILGNHIYTIDAHNYVNSSTIRSYDMAGNFEYEFTAGLNASKLMMH